MSTLQAFLVLASEGAEETSKTPFYVAGGVFAGFAVLVGALGLAKPDFPANAGGERLVVLIAAVLTVGAMATSVITG